ncbi:Dyp-type peroxidase domain-containing protein [Streptomyces sp. NBC_00005]|uniref:Dyp-type peroxidase domain-containing protein n=1 Tax=Streptomyces sp. NBC_00005 TaxID=2903609 RepID=UPI003868434B
MGRRRFLRGTTVDLGGAVAGAGLAKGADTAVAATPAVAPDASADGQAIPYHGPRQTGILPAKQQSACFLSFDVVADTRQELADLMRTLTDRARFLTTGGLASTEGITAPPADSGILGPACPGRRADHHRRRGRLAVRRTASGWPRAVRDG